jgi:hypothetical protein
MRFGKIKDCLCLGISVGNSSREIIYAFWGSAVSGFKLSLHEVLNWNTLICGSLSCKLKLRINLCPLWFFKLMQFIISPLFKSCFHCIFLKLKLLISPFC